MTPGQADALWLHIPRLSARRRRLALEAAGRRLSPEEVYDLTLAETESAEKADLAAAEYAAQLLRNDQTPG